MASPGLVGRSHELQVLSRALHDGVGGPLRVVLIIGEAGMGKTALADALDGEHRPAGVLVLRGGSLLGEEEVPYQGIGRALEPLVHQGHPAVQPLVHLIWGGEQSELAATGAELAALVAQVVAKLSSHQPLLLVLEDLHMADRPTLAVAQRLADEAVRLRGALLLTMRPEHPRVLEGGPIFPALEALRTHPSVQVLTLPPLGAGAVREWFALSGEVAGVPEDLIRRLHQRSGGNPLYLQALVSALQDQGHLTLQQGRWITHLRDLPTTIPSSIVGVITQRLAEVSPIGVRVARLLAAARDAVPPALLRRALALTEVEGGGLGGALPTADTHSTDDRVAAVLRELAQRQLAVDEGGKWRMAHELVRDTLYRGMAAPTRQQTHRWWVQCLEEAGADVFSLAHHSHLAGDLPRTVEYATEAGERALELFAYATAERYLSHALAAAGVGSLPEPVSPFSPEGDRPRLVPSEEATLLLRRAEARFRLGDPEGADLDLVLALQRQPPPSLQGQLLLLRAALQASHGERDLAEAVASEAAALLDPVADLDPVVQARLLQARLQLQRGDLDGTAETLARAAALSRSGGRADLEAAVRSAEGALLRHRGTLDRASEAYRSAVATLESQGMRQELAFALTGLGTVLHEQGSHAQSLLVLQRARELARELGLRQAEGEAMVGEALALVRLLRLEEADRAADGALKLFQRLDDPAGMASAMLVYGILHHTRKEAASGDSFLEQAQSLAVEAGNESLRAEVALESGRALATQGKGDAATERWQEAVILFTAAGELGRAQAVRTLLSARGPDERGQGRASSPGRGR